MKQMNDGCDSNPLSSEYGKCKTVKTDYVWLIQNSQVSGTYGPFQTNCVANMRKSRQILALAFSQINLNRF